jgi:hypothetical protein
MGAATVNHFRRRSAFSNRSEKGGSIFDAPPVSDESKRVSLVSVFGTKWNQITEGSGCK